MGDLAQMLLLRHLLTRMSLDDGNDKKDDDDGKSKKKESLMKALDDDAPNDLFRLVRDRYHAKGPENKTYMQEATQLIDSHRASGDLDVKNAEGCTALFYAMCAGLWKTARLLVEAGADPFDEAGAHSPLRARLAVRQLRSATELCFLLWLFRHLDERNCGAEITRCLNEPFGLVHIMCNGKNPSEIAVELLLKHGADPMSRSVNGGWTGLHYAARGDHASLVHLLVRHGADVNATKADGFTPLHLAAINGNSDAVMALLQAGASVDLLTGDTDEDNPVYNRKTAADLADIKRKPDTARVIRDWNSWHGHAAVATVATQAQSYVI